MTSTRQRRPLQHTLNRTRYSTMGKRLRSQLSERLYLQHWWKLPSRRRFPPITQPAN